MGPEKKIKMKFENVEFQNVPTTTANEQMCLIIFLPSITIHILHTTCLVNFIKQNSKKRLFKRKLESYLPLQTRSY